jgi:putative thioredoxin
MEAAFRRLLALLRRTSGDDRDAVRDRLVEYFELIGPDDPRVGPARRDLTNALF